MRLLPLALAAAIVIVSFPARAQVGHVRERFREGVAAAEAGRWEAALEAFEEVYALHPAPAVLFNLAGALAQNGRLREAADAYRRFERDTPDPSLRAAAERERSAVEARLAFVDVHAEGMQPGDRLALDGDVLGTHARYEALPLDPGEHEVEVRRGERRVASERVVIGEGERREIVVVVAPPEALVVEPVREEPRGEQWFESPVLWTIVGVVIVGAAVGVGVGLATSAPQGPDAPLTDRGPLGVR
ncbi:tetratricopeptide repeat protein [Sandaracinus amylolyticus]|uniref:tetratricopeptide repeat protein n=1 Tax=Sandaracinus amylolyticus TaxID=927083 RepID=UPI00146FD465|nr:tetratricopeptide repeat protein [Sandaracinus amylolyticus]